MNKMLWGLLFLFVGGFLTGKASDQNLIIRPIESSSLEQERQLFIHYWSGVYASASLQQLGLYDLKTFLADSFDQEEYDYFYMKEDVFFGHILLGEKVVGYISYDCSDQTHVCIRQFAIDRNIVDSQLAEELLFMILPYYPFASSLCVHLRVLAKDAVQLFLDLSFAPCSLDCQGTYQLFDFQVGEKCPTCLAYSYDEDDFEDDDFYALSALNGAFASELLDDDLDEYDGEEIGICTPSGCG